MLQYSIYPILLGVCGLVAIILRVPRLNQSSKK